MLLQERRTSYSITFIHLLLPSFSLSSSSSSFTLLVSVKKLEISHDKLRHRCCARATLLHPLQLLQYCSCGIFDFKASFYDLVGDLLSALACYLIHTISSCFQMPNYCILQHAHTHTYLYTWLVSFASFLFLLLYTSKGKIIQSDPEKKATTMRVCVCLRFCEPVGVLF